MQYIIYIGADHGGFQLKERLKLMLNQENVVVHDMGNIEYDQNDEYPDFAKLTAEKVTKGLRARGILISDNGVGMCIAANKTPGIRAFLADDENIVREAVGDHNANILCLGQKYLDMKKAEHIVRVFLQSNFNNQVINKRILKKLAQL